MMHIKNRLPSFLNPFDELRKRPVTGVNPTLPPSRKEPEHTFISVFEYDATSVFYNKLPSPEETFPYERSSKTVWINLGGLRKGDVEKIGEHFSIHPLIVEDILSSGQRPKMDEMSQMLYVVLNMLYYNQSSHSVESEQVSIVLGKNFVISFQEDEERDLFKPVREKIKMAGTKLRLSGADYLFYALIDIIVDHYFIIMETLGERIEGLEDAVTHRPDTRTLARINYLRKEMMFVRRNIAPVRELVNGILRSESELIEEKTEKYFKDVYDHIVQANDLAENYRDMMINLQDLYLSNVNLKMNEVMKVMAVVTCLMAPATVIGGIFGMNFNRIPWLHNPYGFFIAVSLMLIIPVWMIWIFKRRGWF